MPHEPSKTDAPEHPARFAPFADDAAVQTVGGLSIENGTDRIAIHGSLDLARDATGLARARALAETLAAIVGALEVEGPSGQAADATRPPMSVPNPFA